MLLQHCCRFWQQFRTSFFCEISCFWQSWNKSNMFNLFRICRKDETSFSIVAVFWQQCCRNWQTCNHRRRTHRGNGKFAPVLLVEPGQTYSIAPVLFQSSLWPTILSSILVRCSAHSWPPQCGPVVCTLQPWPCCTVALKAQLACRHAHITIGP